MSVEQLPQRLAHRQSAEQLASTSVEPELQTNAESPRQVVAQVEADQLEAEMNGAYSSLGNRHTYIVNSETGKKSSIKRADIMDKADELGALRDIAKGNAVKKSWAEMSDSEQLANAKADGYKNAYIDKERDTLVFGRKQEAKSKDAIFAERDARQNARAIRRDKQAVETGSSNDAHRAKLEEAPAKLAALLRNKQAAESEQKKGDPFSKLISAWALAEKNSDIDGAERAEQKLDELIQQAAEEGVIDPRSVAQIKEQFVSRKNHELSESIEEAKIPTTERVPVSEVEDVAEDKKISLRKRLASVKNSIKLLPAKIPGMLEKFKDPTISPEKENDSRRRTIIALGVVTTGLVAVYAGNKYGIDLPFVGEGGGSGGGNSLAVTPDLLAPEQADTSLLDQMVDGNSRLAQETAALATPDFSQFEYPIDWAMQNGGADAPLEFLKSLGERAAQDGHNVQWMPAAGGGEYVVVDGMTSAEDTLRILSQYKS